MHVIFLEFPVESIHLYVQTFFIPWHLAGSVKPIIFSGEQILTKGKSEFLAICAASDVLPLPGGPINTNNSKYLHPVGQNTG